MNLTARSSHFEFGENWREYAKTIDQARIDAAVIGLKKLFPEGLAEARFLDIGCGSGIHSLAALMLGAKSVLSIDIDENSVATTRELLSRFAPGGAWEAREQSVFDASAEKLGGAFDVVYSWGVLHHTGDMWRAIEQASKLVKPNGLFCLAICSATTFDPIWKIEKRIYSSAPRAVQWLLRQIYIAAFLSAQALIYRVNPVRYLRDYKRKRGMNFSHDVHDWLGGYPYETATAEELSGRVRAMGFSEVRSFALPVTRGIFGSGCNEFVFQAI